MLEIVQIGRNKKLALSLKWDQDRLKPEAVVFKCGCMYVISYAATAVFMING
jgi:hypothetical protein